MSSQPVIDPSGRGAVYRDAYGVPHLWAERVDDLAYVQGFEAAYERAWQLEHNRLRAEGRTAAVLGRSALDWDVFARRARLVDTARRAFDRLDGRTRAWCTAYVAGVNDALPLGAADSAEFAALDLVPGRWRSWTPLAVFAGIHILFGTCQYKLWREHVAATAGPELVNLFAAEGAAGDGAGTGGAESDASGGSNAFGVTASLSPTGLPVVAGDPHRTFEVPNVYQQVRLACPAFDVVGLAFPGVPGIQHFGHAGAVAWATTNAMADYQDFYVERLTADPATGAVSARGPAGDEPVDRQPERIAVRDGGDVVVDALETTRGPVVLGEVGGRTYSLRTPSRVQLDLGFGALLPLLHARSVADVEAAMTAWVEPVNVLVMADATGRLRERVVGLVPERSEANRRLPADAADDSTVWTGRYRHPDGRDGERVVNANDRASGADLGYDYAAPGRSYRIRALLEDGAAFAPAGLGAVSLDVDQPAVATLRRLLTDLGADGLTASASALRGELLGWDGLATAVSTTAARFAAWRAALVRWLLAQPALAPLTVTDELPDLFARWVDPVIRVGAVWEQLCAESDRLGFDLGVGVRTALEEAAADPTGAPWGAVHRYAPLHPLTGRPGGPDLPDTALSGDTGCVLAARGYPGLTDAASFGPVARYVWDLNDREASRWVVPLGTSTRTSSPHRVDQLPRWARGETIPVTTAWAALRLDRVLPGRDRRRHQQRASGTPDD